MDAKELRGKSPTELREQLLSLYREHFNLRVQRATGQLGNPSRFRALRREIARVKTIMNEQKRTGA